METYFYNIHYWGLFVFNSFMSLYLLGGKNSTIDSRSKTTGNNINVVIFTIVWSLFIGFRPHTEYFGDTVLYVGTYNTINSNDMYTNEPVFRYLNKIFYNLGCSVELFFAFVAYIYILPLVLYSRKMITQRYLWVCFLMILSSFSFFGYAINGIRSGLAGSLFIMGLYFFNALKNSNVLCCMFMLMAYFTHKSMLLPIGMFLVSIFLVKDIKQALILWVISIPISFLFGGPIANLLASMGIFDDRLEGYLFGEIHHGFRWDFLLYSIVPICFAYYLRIKKQIIDKNYTLLVNTYMLSNAIWIIVINASFSNRFAYLSWFLYPLVMAYPLFNFKIWKKQDIGVALTSFLYFFFTFFMWIIGK